MKRTPRHHSNPISVGLTLFFGATAVMLMLIRLAVEGGLPGAVLVVGLAPVLTGLTVAGLIVVVRRGTVALNPPSLPARACGRPS